MCVKEKKKENAAKQKEKEKGMYTKVGSGRRLCNGDMMIMDMEYKAGRGIVKGLNHLVCIHDGRG